ncbi:MAG: dethiobiotin synthase [Dissulfuribacterales bacterium]
MKLAVTGTNTGVGKTISTAILASAWHAAGLKIEVQKWVSTGDTATAEDLRLIYEAMARPVPGAGSHHAPYCLKLPASPHLAARLEGVQIDKKRLIEATFILESACDILLIEGAGGPFSPINDEILFADLVLELHLPIILVTITAIGTINQTLAHIEALQGRGIEILAIIFNENTLLDPVIATDSMAFVAGRTDIPVLGPVPFSKQPIDFMGLNDTGIPTAVLKLLENGK